MKRKKGFWTKKNCINELKKYNSRSEFKKKSGGAWCAACSFSRDFFWVCGVVELLALVMLPLRFFGVSDVFEVVGEGRVVDQPAQGALVIVDLGRDRGRASDELVDVVELLAHDGAGLFDFLARRDQRRNTVVVASADEAYVGAGGAEESNVGIRG